MTFLAAGAANDTFLLAGFILAGLAVLLLFVELVVPSGGLIGLLCGVATIASVVAFFKYDTTWGLVAMLAYLVLGPIGVAFAFKLWLHSPLARRMILGAEDVTRSDEEAAAAAEESRRRRLAQLQELIGAEGITVTALRPVGVVKIEGQRVDALSEAGVIEARTPVVVTDILDNQIRVRPKA
jgi:membrane-bound serine protease (ClpP class)